MTRTLIVVTVLLTATTAHAKSLGPSVGYGVLTIVRPHHDEQAVPLNTRIWLDELSATDSANYATPRDPRLFDPDGVPILLGTPISITAPGGQLLVYTPPAPLLPNTTYELRNCDADECDHLLASFVTADAPDVDPPAPPEISSVLLAGNLELDATFADNILVIGPDEDPLAEPLVSQSLLGAATQEHPLDVQNGDLDANIDRLRFATYDLAANFSGWTPPVDIERPSADLPVGCRAVAVAPTPWLLLALLAVRRRRRVL